MTIFSSDLYIFINHYNILYFFCQVIFTDLCVTLLNLCEHRCVSHLEAFSLTAVSAFSSALLRKKTEIFAEIWWRIKVGANCVRPRNSRKHPSYPNKLFLFRQMPAGRPQVSPTTNIDVSSEFVGTVRLWIFNPGRSAKSTKHTRL